MGPLRSRNACSRRVLVALVALAAGFAASTADAAIYKYVDRSGVSHYSDSLSSVPEEYRDRVRDITAEMGDKPNVQIVPGQGAEAPAADPDEGSPLEAVDLGAANLGESGGMIRNLLESAGFGVLLLVLLAIPVLFVVSALIFKLACRLAGEDPPGLGRACVVLFVQSLAGSAVGAAVSGVSMVLGLEQSAGLGLSLAMGGLSSLLSWLASAGVLTAMLGYAFLRSMWICVLNTLLVIVMVGAPIAAVAVVGMLVS